MEVNLGKWLLAGIAAGITVCTKALAIPIIILICFMLLDYLTGLASAWISRSLSSREGVIGIIKKVCYLVMIAVGMGADWIVCSGLERVGITVDTTYAVSMIITMWLLINELISIMENISEINKEKTPEFLKKLLMRLKNAVEEKTGE